MTTSSSCVSEQSVWQTLWHCLETGRRSLITDLLTQINAMAPEPSVHIVWLTHLLYYSASVVHLHSCLRSLNHGRFHWPQIIGATSYVNFAYAVHSLYKVSIAPREKWLT